MPGCLPVGHFVPENGLDGQMGGQMGGQKGRSKYRFNPTIFSEKYIFPSKNE